MKISGVEPVQFGQHKVYVYDTSNDLVNAATDFISRYCADIAAQQKNVSIALSGGSTPVKIYQKLLEQPYLDSMPWQEMQFYFGDERYVPHDDDQSNYKMAMTSFLNHAPVESSQIHAVPTDCDAPDNCAEQYEKVLAEHTGDNNSIDLALLGMGDDGHTASLFPGTDILTEQNKWVAAVYVEKFKSWRISMTYPVFNQAKSVCVLVAGEAKANVLRQVLTEPDAGYPIQNIANPNGMIWLIDTAAAGKLSN